MITDADVLAMAAGFWTGCVEAAKRWAPGRLSRVEIEVICHEMLEQDMRRHGASAHEVRVVADGISPASGEGHMTVKRGGVPDPQHPSKQLTK